MATGVERFYEEAAYVAGLMVFLMENKSDNEADAEIGDILEHRPYMLYVVIDVMEKMQ